MNCTKESIKMDNRNENEWETAIALMGEWEKGVGHLDDLLESHDPGKTRWLVMEVFREWLRIDRILGILIKKEPRPRTRNLLRLAVGEFLDRDAERQPRIVHHAVETAKKMGISKAECGFINGVLRSIIRKWDDFGKIDQKTTHPEWLVNRWIDQLGESNAMQLVSWNQQVPKLTIRAKACPGYAKETPWNGFYSIESGRFAEVIEDLRTGNAYMQDPFTRIPVELLGVKKGEHVLDLCAAPGGKTRLIAEALDGTGRLLAVDKPGHRLDRLTGNLSQLGYRNIEVLGSRLEELDEGILKILSGRKKMDAILIDVPCSNTGVIQKRPDVKLRIKESSFVVHANQQKMLLKNAARWVRPGGRLVYSTCSIDSEENSQVVESFLEQNPQWKLEQSVMSYPWECDHDGGGAFLLTRALPE
jgi:16S rRNA (cytosine967-C5)-methyltransferase